MCARSADRRSPRRPVYICTSVGTIDPMEPSALSGDRVVAVCEIGIGRGTRTRTGPGPRAAVGGADVAVGVVAMSNSFTRN